MKDKASDVNGDGQDEDRRARFRRVYMEKLVEGFGSDLDKLRTVSSHDQPSKIVLYEIGTDEDSLIQR
jgi:ribosome assembly protein 3